MLHRATAGNPLALLELQAADLDVVESVETGLPLARAARGRRRVRPAARGPGCRLPFGPARRSGVRNGPPAHHGRLRRARRRCRAARRSRGSRAGVGARRSRGVPASAAARRGVLRRIDAAASCGASGGRRCDARGGRGPARLAPRRGDVASRCGRRRPARRCRRQRRRACRLRGRVRGVRAVCAPDAGHRSAPRATAARRRHGMDGRQRNPRPPAARRTSTGCAG